MQSTKLRDAPATPPAKLPAGVGHVRALARLLDTAVRIPGTNFRFGADSLIGLIPGFGDVAGALMSGYIVLVATRLGLPAPVVTRMLMNIGIDTLVGAVPVLGDLFDVAWKSNRKNVELIEAHVADQTATTRSSSWMVTGIVVVAILVFVLMGAGIIALLRKLF